MKRTKPLRKSLLSSHLLVALIPLLSVGGLILFFFGKSMYDDVLVRIGMLAQGSRGQIQLFMDQPRSNLETIGRLMTDHPLTAQEMTMVLNSHSHDSRFFESIYLLDRRGVVTSVGLARDREQYRDDLLHINLGHKAEFKRAMATGQQQWSDTFLSLSSGKISLTLYVPVGNQVLAADINLYSLYQFITRLSVGKVVTMVVDRNGAIIFHPDPSLVGTSVTLNDIQLVADALAGRESVGTFTFMGQTYLGAANVIEPAGWITLIAEPTDRLRQRLLVPLIIVTAGLLGAVLLSLLLAIYKARKLATPLTEMTGQSVVIAGGDYTKSMEASSISELEQLASSINGMATAIQRRELELRENELKYRELVEYTSNIVLRLDEQLRIGYVNHPVEQFTGFCGEEVRGRSLLDFLEPEAVTTFTQALDDLKTAGQESGTIETTLVHRDGTRRNLLFAVNLHYQDGGRLQDISAIGHDITVRYELEKHRQEMEHQRQQSQKMEMLGMMAGGVAHDLNNILAGIINYPELLLLRLEADSPLRAPLQAIKKSGERAAAVVADLLTVARQSAAVHEVTDLNLLITGFVESPHFEKICHHHPDVQFTFQPASRLWYCHCSPVHIEKTLMNLVLNGFEAVGERGRVFVATANVDERHLQVGLDLAAGNYVRIDVGDDGPGIAPEDLERIFEPFFSKKGLGRSGTGLGLAVAWSTVRDHGGSIAVTSEPSGTMFSVYLPATRQQPTGEEVAAGGEPLQGAGERILVVDDEEHLRDIAEGMLTTLGYRVQSAASGEAALQLLERERFSLVLLDMQMDPGLSGRQTYQRMARVVPGIPAIIVSGYSKSEDVEATMQLGATAFLKKPYSLETLGEAVRRVLQPEQGD